MAQCVFFNLIAVALLSKHLYAQCTERRKKRDQIVFFFWLNLYYGRIDFSSFSLFSSSMVDDTVENWFPKQSIIIGINFFFCFIFNFFSLFQSMVFVLFFVFFLIDFWFYEIRGILLKLKNNTPFRLFICVLNRQSFFFRLSERKKNSCLSPYHFKCTQNHHYVNITDNRTKIKIQYNNRGCAITLQPTLKTSIENWKWLAGIKYAHR